MQKTLVAFIILVLVGAGLHYVLTQYKPSSDALSELNQPAPVEGEIAAGDQEVRGTVVAVNTEQSAFDGPVLILVTQDSGEPAVIAVPSMGLPTCVAYETIADPFTLQPGQMISTRGTVGEDGAITPCTSPEHFLAVIEAI